MTPFRSALPSSHAVAATAPVAAAAAHPVTFLVTGLSWSVPFLVSAIPGQCLSWSVPFLVSAFPGQSHTTSVGLFANRSQCLDAEGYLLVIAYRQFAN